MFIEVFSWIVPISIFIVFFTIGLIALLDIQKRYRQVFQRFAKTHGFTYSEQGSLDTENGSVMSYGKFQYMTDVVEGKWESFPVRVFCYYYNDKDPKTKAYDPFLIVRFDIGARFPRLFIKHRRHENEGRFTYGLKPLVLESAEFNKVYELFVTQGKQVDALQIIETDFMSFLLESGMPYDIELVEDHLYVYAYITTASNDTMETLFKTSTTILNQLKSDIERRKRLMNTSNQVHT